MKQRMPWRIRKAKSTPPKKNQNQKKHKKTKQERRTTAAGSSSTIWKRVVHRRNNSQKMDDNWAMLSFGLQQKRDLRNCIWQSMRMLMRKFRPMLSSMYSWMSVKTWAHQFSMCTITKRTRNQSQLMNVACGVETPTAMDECKTKPNIA